MGEDRPLRHRVLQHHVNLRCDSAGCPPPAHLTWSAMTPGATPTGCLRGSSIAVLPCRSGKRCSYRDWPGLACLPGGAGPGRCPLAGAGMRTWQDGITGSLLPGILPRQAHRAARLRVGTGRSCRLGCLYRQPTHRRDPVLEL